VKYVLEWAVTVVQYALSFYGFWLVWRVLLPVLPGPRDPSDRVVPYVWYFTDPFVNPVAKALHVPSRLIALVALVVVAAVSVALGRLPGLA
jgi:uncharacterized protein YggT (Ycf19 family)